MFAEQAASVRNRIDTRPSGATPERGAIWLDVQTRLLPAVMSGSATLLVTPLVTK